MDVFNSTDRFNPPQHTHAHTPTSMEQMYDQEKIHCTKKVVFKIKI